MKSKILVVGFALLSVFAVAQSSSNQADSAKKSSDTKQGRDAATGQASGKAAAKPADSQSVQTAREASSGMATGKVATTDKNDAQLKRVAAGDVNGDGKADAAPATSGDQKAATTSDVKSPRDLATGQASGKRQHQPVLDSAATSSSSDSKEPAKK